MTDKDDKLKALKNANTARSLLWQARDLVRDFDDTTPYSIPSNYFGYSARMAAWLSELIEQLEAEI